MLQGYGRFIFAFVALVFSEVAKPQLDEFTRGEELIYLPADYSESNSYPLVILLHAYVKLSQYGGSPSRLVNIILFMQFPPAL